MMSRDPFGIRQIQKPTPPTGFVQFRWKSKQHYPDGRDHPETGHSVQICPYCGSPGQDEDSWGWVSGGRQPGLRLDLENNCWWGWTDQGALDAYIKAFRQTELLREQGKFLDALCFLYDEVMLKCHWSRWGSKQCVVCENIVWHDWVGFPHTSYWKPSVRVGEDEKGKPVFAKQLALDF